MTRLTIPQETRRRNNIMVTSLIQVIDEVRHEILADQLADKIEADLDDTLDLSFQDVGGGLVPADQSPEVVAALLHAHHGRYVHIDAVTATKAWRKELADACEYRLSYITAPSGILRICTR